MSRVAKACIHVPRTRDEFKKGFVELSLRSSLFGPVSIMVLIISIKGRHIALEKSGERVSMSSNSAVCTKKVHVSYKTQKKSTH